MILNDIVQTPIWPVVAAWVRHLADRFAMMQEQVRLGVIEVICRTAAEATEVALHSIFNIARTDEINRSEYLIDELHGEPHQENELLAPPTPKLECHRPTWSLRTTARATLHGVSWWLRQRTPHPLTTAAMTLISAALILLD